nr:unnamed protein product [Digitaria exilis]
MAVSLVTLLVTLVVVPLLAFLLLSSARKQRADGRRLPPSPPGLPLLGHLHLLGRLPHRALRSLAVAHGPVMLLRLGRVPTVARRVFALHLLAPRRVASFRSAREREVATLVARVRHATAAAASGGLSDALISYSKAIISRAAFGDGDYGLAGDKDGEKLRRVLDDFQELVMATPVREISPWLGWVDTLSGLEAKTRRTFEALDGLLERVIADHRRRRVCGRRQVLAADGEVDDHRDFVDVLLDVNEMDNESGLRLDTDNIKAIIMVYQSCC